MSSVPALRPGQRGGAAVHAHYGLAGSRLHIAMQTITIDNSNQCPLVPIRGTTNCDRKAP